MSSPCSSRGGAADAPDRVDVDAAFDRRGAQLGQHVPDDDVGDVVALDRVEHVVDVGRRRVHQRAARAQHLQRVGDAAHPERRQQRHGAIAARSCRKYGASTRGWRATAHWPCTTAFGAAVLPEV